MKRRTLLRSAALLPLSQPLLGSACSRRSERPSASGVLEAGQGARVYRRVRPGDAAWPSAARWAELRDAVGGNLIEGRALFADCEAAPNSAGCVEAREHIGNPYWIGDQPTGTEVSGWLDAWTPAPSAYVVRARHAADVAAAVTFARRHHLRLVVKGGGHSYLGTSNAPDSLLVWTRGMRRILLHDTFVPSGCEGRVEPVPAVTAEAGAVWMDLYNAVTGEAGRYVQGGGCTTVGVAGLVQSGGFGSFSKRFGTVAGNLLEAEVVTADGRVRVANACSEQDLFWALKGGGGGTFGVVTRLTLRTHELPATFGAASGEIRARSDAAFARLIARFIALYRDDLFNPHWGEQVRLRGDNTLEIAMVSQGLDAAQTRAPWESLFAWAGESPDDFVVQAPLRAGATAARRWWAVDDNPAMIRDTRPGALPNRGWWQGDQEQVGAFIHGFDSVWLPAALLHAARQSALADALFAASRHQRVELHFNKGLAGAPPEALAACRDTAMNPAALDAFALAIVATGEAPAYPGLARPAIDVAAARANARAIDAAAAALRAVAPDAGSYLSESNYFNAAWRAAYWGKHYARLADVKRRYDPDGLFIVHHGVGSEEWSPDAFTRAQ